MKKTPSGAHAGNPVKTKKNPVLSGKNASNRDEAPYAVEGEKCGSEGVPPPPSAAWMSPALMEKTHVVWSKRYGRPLEQHEAVEILDNVRRFAEVVRRLLSGGK